MVNGELQVERTSLSRDCVDPGPHLVGSLSKIVVQGKTLT